jgi:hypothetical protein
MTSITLQYSIGGPWLKLIKLTLLDNKAPITKSPEMAHSRCSLVHELITHLIQEGQKKNLVPNMARGIHHLNPISPWSHLKKGTVFPLNHTILTSHIGRRKLIFETQITTKGFELRFFKLSVIVAKNSLNRSPFVSSSTSRLDPGQNQMSPPC